MERKFARMIYINKKAKAGQRIFNYQYYNCPGCAHLDFYWSYWLSLKKYSSMWTGFKNEHARKGSDHTSAFLPCRHIYLQLLLQDFSKDFMLISKNTESCRLNIVSTGCNTAAAPAAAADLLIYLPEPSRAEPLSLLCCPFSARRQQSSDPQCFGFITMQSRSDAQL